MLQAIVCEKNQNQTKENIFYLRKLDAFFQLFKSFFSQLKLQTKLYILKTYNKPQEGNNAYIRLQEFPVQYRNKNIQLFILTPNHKHTRIIEKMIFDYYDAPVTIFQCLLVIKMFHFVYYTQIATSFLNLLQNVFYTRRNFLNREFLYLPNIKNEWTGESISQMIPIKRLLGYRESFVAHKNKSRVIVLTTL